MGDFIPLTKEEEDSLLELHSLHSYTQGITDALNIVEKELGKMNKVACLIRRDLLVNKHYKEMQEYTSKESSINLQTKLFKRLENG